VGTDCFSFKISQEKSSKIGVTKQISHTGYREIFLQIIPCVEYLYIYIYIYYEFFNKKLSICQAFPLEGRICYSRKHKRQ
jgi:hypothetical protein